jgi:predicted protein tyrosine phosphatase
MDIFVYSRSALSMVAPHDVAHVIISITSSTDDVASLRIHPTCRGVLRLAFVDAEVGSPPYIGSDLFSQEQARSIWDFVRQHVGQIERIVVHCDAGVSRSPAVAAALSRVLNGDDAAFFGGPYRPNMHVYRTLLETHRRDDVDITRPLS